MNNIYFTSDTHWGHRNILKYVPRLQFLNTYETQIINSQDKEAIDELYISDESINRMDEAMIERWNSVVQRSDRVYHLGDIFICDPDRAQRILNRLNGEIHLIQGNHDRTAKLMKHSFASFNKMNEIKITDRDAQRGERRIVLCHYAMRVWNKSHHGAYHLYGHSHGSLPDDPNSLSFDCGVDCHNYTPISYEEVKQIMSTKTYVPIDHHGLEQ